MNKFWNWIRDDTGTRVLRLEGPIDSESFWGDEITPAMFRQELEAEEGDLTVWINSPGGNVFAAAEIYSTRERSLLRLHRSRHLLHRSLPWQGAAYSCLRQHSL